MLLIGRSMRDLNCAKKQTRFNYFLGFETAMKVWERKSTVRLYSSKHACDKALIIQKCQQPILYWKQFSFPDRNPKRMCEHHNILPTLMDFHGSSGKLQMTKTSTEKQASWSWKELARRVAWIKVNDYWHRIVLKGSRVLKNPEIVTVRKKPRQVESATAATTTRTVCKKCFAKLKPIPSEPSRMSQQSSSNHVPWRKKLMGNLNWSWNTDANT